jgi:gamma-glutamylcysteine synthetase
MSGPSSANDTQITDYRQLVEVMASGEKPIDAWRIGTEHEKFGFRRPLLMASAGSKRCSRDSSVLVGRRLKNTAA